MAAGTVSLGISATKATVEDLPRRPVLVVAMCAAMHAIGGGLGWSVMPALMPVVAKDMGLGHAASGFAFGAASLGIALASPIGGAAVDRHGARKVAGLAMIAGALACAARAFATGTWSLAAAMFVFGLHVGFTAPAIPKALSGHVKPQQIARANGFALLAYTLGTAVTILVARTVLVPAFGSWRAVMVASGAAMAIAAVGWLLLVRDGASLSRHAKVTDALALVRDGQIRRVAAMHFLVFGGYLALLSLLPRALMESGMSPARVAGAIATWLVCAGLANFGGPWLSDAIGRRKALFLGGALLAGSALLAVAAAAAFAPSKVPIFLAIAAIGGGSFAPLLLTAPLELPGIGPAKAGAALGLLMLVGQMGGFLLPVVSGAMAQAAGSPAALAVLAAAHLLVVVPAIGLRSR
ncbi:MAG: MFS transporter [Labilithrix sp.]|nr:MFS transporter [Labilithrix sp.]